MSTVSANHEHCSIYHGVFCSALNAYILHCNSKNKRGSIKVILIFSFYLLQTMVGGRQNSVVIQKLQPDTPYAITVSSMYADGEGGRMTGRGRTSK